MVGSGGADFVVARYLADGRLDTSFGNSGRTRVNYAGLDVARDVQVQPDGKIVVVGGVNQDADVGLLRLTSSGRLDSTFGIGGKVVSNISGNDRAESVALTRDGKRLFATNLASGRLSVIDTETLETIASIATGSRCHGPDS